MNHNYIRCIQAFHYLQQCLYLLCEKVISKQHRSILDKLPKFQGSCNSCTLDSLLPYHQHEQKECPCISKSKCYCSKRAKARTLCPNDGFCSKLCDIITLAHRFRDPFLKNSDPRKWKENFWMIAVCYINTQGYHDKSSAQETDIRGLLSIIINNIEFEAELTGFQINGQDDLFKKARDFNNDLHHSANYVIGDSCTRKGINLVRSILEIPQLQNETYVKEVLNDFLSDRNLMELGAAVILHAPGISIAYTEMDNTCSTTITTNDVKDDEKETKGFLQLNSKTVYAEDSATQCRHPGYQSYESRLSTFTDWPRHLMQRPEDLADAGLFYTGVEDLVRCFSCDGGLKRWNPEDDPWTEHCRWFPACKYAREEKGEEFIALVLASSAYNQEEPTNNGESLSSAMEQMRLRDPVLDTALEEHKTTCLEMGYDIADVIEAVDNLRNWGTIKLTIEELLDEIEVVMERRSLINPFLGTSAEENQCLKNFGIKCGQNRTNCICLPSTHHGKCMQCAELSTKCKVRDRDKSFDPALHK